MFADKSSHRQTQPQNKIFCALRNIPWPHVGSKFRESKLAWGSTRSNCKLPTISHHCTTI